MSIAKAAMNVRENRELIRLWLLANEGLASDAQLADLNRRVVENPGDRQLLIEMAQQQGWLKWNAVGSDFSGILAAQSADRCPSPTSLPEGEPAPRQRGRRPRRFEDTGHWARRLKKWRSTGLTWGGLAAIAVACVAGFISGSRVGRNAFQIDAQLPSGVDPSVAAFMQQATMVSSTGCVWGSAQPADWLAADSTSGDSIQLLEGIAEFNVGALAELRLKVEGPTSVVLASQPGASIAYGKIILSSSSADGSVYPIESPFGRVLVAPGAEVGLITFGSNAEIHCFRGEVTIESPWLQPDAPHSSDTLLHAGESLLFQDVGRAVLQARRGNADKRQFTPQVAMSNDFLSVSSEYVREVVAAGPVAYWRFEDADASAKNEMGPSYQGRIKGEVARVGPVGNQSLELGLNGKHGSLLADESWDDVLQGDFSIELWMKPNHHHLGSMVGFVGEFDPALRRNRHGVLIETCGPVEGWRVNRVRFLHRSELTGDPKDGVSCFSRGPYEARRWQHVVATKEGHQLRLYVDGKLVHTEVDPAATPQGLQLVIGQLYTETLERFFIGQLDEIAVYDRSLSAEEVTRHHELLRPTPQPSRDVL